MNSEHFNTKAMQLNQRLRVLILQNARESSVYDDRFLFEMHQISEQLLRLRKLGKRPLKQEGRRYHSGPIPNLVAQSL